MSAREDLEAFARRDCWLLTQDGMLKTLDLLVATMNVWRQRALEAEAKLRGLQVEP